MKKHSSLFPTGLFLFGAIVLLQTSALHAMPKYDSSDGQSASIDLLITEQSDALKSGDNAKALAANAKIAEELAKNDSAKPIDTAMVTYDRAVILDRLGHRSDALELMNESYAKGLLDKLYDTSTLPPDYYGIAMDTYINWLRESDGSDWREVQDHFVKTLYSNELSNRRIEIAAWISSAMTIRTDIGDYDVAHKLCQEHLTWFGNLDLSSSRSFYFGRPTVFVDDAGTYITGVAIRQGKFNDHYNFMAADTRDSCAAAYEASGDTETALNFRADVRAMITTKGPKEFLPLVTLRFARLLAFTGDIEQAASFLSVSIDQYTAQLGAANAQSAFCESLSFTLSGKVISNREVWAKFLSKPSTAKAVARFDCNSI